MVSTTLQPPSLTLVITVLILLHCVPHMIEQHGELKMRLDFMMLLRMESGISRLLARPAGIVLRLLAACYYLFL